MNRNHFLKCHMTSSPSSPSENTDIIRVNSFKCLYSCHLNLSQPNMGESYPRGLKTEKLSSGPVKIRTTRLALCEPMRTRKKKKTGLSFCGPLRIRTTEKIPCGPKRNRTTEWASWERRITRTKRGDLCKLLTQTSNAEQTQRYQHAVKLPPVSGSTFI